MMRYAIRGFVMLALLTLVVTSTGRGQGILDSVEVRNRKDGTVKPYSGVLKVTPAGFQVFSGEKLEKASEAFSPDDIVKFKVGDLPGMDRIEFNALRDKEDKRTVKDLTEARAGYQDLLKKAASAPNQTKRHLAFKVATANHKIVDELDPDQGWKEKADEAIKLWSNFINDYKDKAAFGWEVWPAVRAITRLQIERGLYDDAARSWAKIKNAPDLPPDAKLEAALQEIDLQIRAKAYAAASVAIPALLNTATGARKDRLTIYEIAAKAGADGKHIEGIKPIADAMDKSKDASVHATGYAMMAELYLATGKNPREAMWAFLWVETVLNQDKDDVFKAICRLAEHFEAQMDEDQSKKYRDKLKRYRATF